MKSRLISKQWGSLTVIEFDNASGRFKCKCTCGGTIFLSKYQISGRLNSCCERCKKSEQYRRSIQIDREQLRGLSDDLAKKIIRRFVVHVRLSHDNDVQATSWTKFVTEIRENPDLAEDDPVLTVDERLEAATWQQFQVYVSPQFQVGGKTE